MTREALLARLLSLTHEHPVTLICAPAGSGKTTLMVQRADAAAPDETCVWVALDESDNDPARLLATLVHSLQQLDLHWEREPAGHRTGLYERAAAAEDQPERAIGHWLDAGRWNEALQLMVRHGPALAAGGACASLERWMERLPPANVQAEPRLALLRAECGRNCCWRPRWAPSAGWPSGPS